MHHTPMYTVFVSTWLTIVFGILYVFLSSIIANICRAIAQLGTNPWETPFGVVEDGMDNVINFYSYGDMPPWGNGPHPHRIEYVCCHVGVLSGLCVFLACLTCVLLSLWARPFSLFLLDYDDCHLLLSPQKRGRVVH